MPAKGREHFDAYPAQTQAKHLILEKYFSAYLKALGRYVDAFLYVDGFAGTGNYEGTRRGSPLIALDLLAAQQLPASISLIESDNESFASLQSAVLPHQKYPALVDPQLVNDEFENVIEPVLSHAIYRHHLRVATFAFIDPCGVKGVRIDDLVRLLERPKSECLLFWNYDAVNRWLGAVIKGTHPDARLREFFGGDDELSEALAVYHGGTTSESKEAMLRDRYTHTIRQRSGAQFVIPFRFQARESTRTSHYLIHFSKHPLAFKIMKEVMFGAKSSTTDGGIFEFLTPNELGVQTRLFRPAIEVAEHALLEQLKLGPQRVGLFTEEWPRRPEDYLVAADYRLIILGLEREGHVVILDPETRQLKPPSNRNRRGVTTLAERLIVMRSAND